MSELDGHIAIVTGGSRGIGRAIASDLALGGAAVAVAGRDGVRARTAAKDLEGNARGFACDVADPEACRELIERVEDVLGPVTIVVNNAGVTRDNILPRLRDEEWDVVLDTNLRGAFNMMRAVARGMMKRRSGRIINIASVVGLTGNRGQANYAASKAGLIGLTKSAAQELASRGVTANVVAPGFIETDMTAKLDGEVREQLRARIPLGRLGQPSDVASIVRFLAGPGADYITGQVFVVDGGMVM